MATGRGERERMPPRGENCQSIRAMPVINLKGIGRFVLCDGLRCRGVTCTYAHSEEEQSAWNSRLKMLRNEKTILCTMSLDDLKSKVPPEKQDISGNPRLVKDKMKSIPRQMGQIKEKHAKNWQANVPRETISVTSIYEDQSSEDHAKPSEENNVMSINVTISGKGVKIVHGKWLVFEKMDSIDEIWSMIVEAMKKDKLGGCIEAKCSTRFFNPAAYGQGPVTTNQISVYTTEDNKMEVGKKLVHLVQRDIRYKLEEDTQNGRYSHIDPGLRTECFCYNNGHPFLLENNICPGIMDDGEDKWRLNVVECPKLQSEDIFGYWELVIEGEPLTNLWHYLKDKIQSEEKSLGAIKMVCPKNLQKKNKPTFQVFTSKSQMLATGLTLIHVMEKDIEFIELESCHVTKVVWKSTI